MNEKKSVLPRTAVRGLITGFVSYGIILMVIFLAAVVLITYFIDNHKDIMNYDILKYTLPLLAVVTIFFLVRFTCKLSTFDSFKYCKIEKEEINEVCTKMNFFYICLIAFSVVVIIVYLITRFSNERVQINRDLMIYRQYNSIYAEEKEREIIDEYESNRVNTLFQTVVAEIGLLLGIFSLIPVQKKLIERYN